MGLTSVAVKESVTAGALHKLKVPTLNWSIQAVQWRRSRPHRAKGTERA